MTTHPKLIARINQSLAKGDGVLDLSGLDGAQFANMLPEFEGLHELMQLSLKDCHLTQVPDWVIGLAELQHLDVSFNQIESLPEGIAKLSRFQSLVVSRNRLSALPESIAKLNQLQYLDVSFNRLTVLPECIALLGRLQYLVISGNQIETLPKGIAQMSRLQTLFVSRNRLRYLPESIVQLSELQILIVAGNRLVALPEGIAKLHRLQYLGASNNQLEVLPDSISNMKCLRSLDVANNRLAVLPAKLQMLSLNDIWLQGNPGLGIADAILGAYVEPRKRGKANIRNPASILDAYFASKAEDSQYLDEIKLLLVGRGAAGKTAIAQRLICDRFEPGAKETEGIDITRWALHCGQRDIDINVWDFAGQVVTHSTHQFFLSESSVYVLVLTGREDSQRSDAEYWLRLIRAFGTDRSGKTSPVVVVLNKFDLHPFRVDRNLLREKYPFIDAFIETDCESGLGIEALRTRLQQVIGKMPFIQQSFKSAWWRIKKRLEEAQKKNNHFPYSTFQSICAEEGETDADRQRFLADVFHSLGVALNYGNDERLRDAMVLNPLWVTDCIYKLLRHGVPDGDTTAVLTMKRVGEVLPIEPDNMRRYLVDLMRRFDLAFPIGELGNEWLLPQRLSAEQPNLGDEWKAKKNVTRIRYCYPVIPEGLLPRFISRTYLLSEREDASSSLPRWTNGVVLQDRNARALVRVNHEDRRIEVTCTGPYKERRILLGVIQTDFATLHQQISGLDQVKELEIEGYPGEFVAEEGLLADEQARNPSSTSTRRGTVSLDATQELDRLSEPASRREEWRPRVFISYSSADARQKDKLLTRLKPMRTTSGLIETWDDRCINTGEDWDGIIRKELEIADVILLLVSPTFMASDYILSVEIKLALDRVKSRRAILIPIILEKCGYQGTSFGHLNALPRKGVAVKDHKPQRDAWFAIEEELRVLFEGLRENRKQQIDALFRSSKVPVIGYPPSKDDNHAKEVAEIMRAMGFGNNDLSTPTEQLGKEPMQALRHWLKLLDVYRENGQREEFERSAEELAMNYNVRPAGWDEAPGGAQTIEDYAWITERLVELWGGSGCLELMQELLDDNREGARSGFPQAIAEELLLLCSIVREVCDNQ